MPEPKRSNPPIEDADWQRWRGGLDAKVDNIIEDVTEIKAATEIIRRKIGIIETKAAGMATIISFVVAAITAYIVRLFGGQQQ